MKKISFLMALLLILSVLHPLRQASAAKEGLLIITKESETVFSEYVGMRQSHGYNVFFQPLRDLINDDGRADRDLIRKKIIEFKKSKNITHVMLVGDLNLIPMPYASPSSLDGASDADLVDTPTDYYYSTASSNWNKDGDDRIGEYEDDGIVDYKPDVAIGRLPFNDTNSVIDAINSVIGFENLPDFVKAKTFLAGAMLGYKGEVWSGMYLERTDGSQFLEDLYADFLKKDGFSRYRIYEKSGFSPSPYECEEEISNQNMISQLGETYGLTIWTAHGSPNSIVRHVWKDNSSGKSAPEKNDISQTPLLSSQDVLSKKNNWGIIVSASCSTSNPNTSTNLGASFVKNGAVGYIGSSRVAWSPSYWRTVEDGGMDSILYLLIQNLTNGMTVGSALDMAKYEFATKYFFGDIEDPVQASQMNIFNFNLYGDPTVKIFREKHGKGNPNPLYCNIIVDNPTANAIQGENVLWSGSYNGTPNESMIVTVLPGIIDDGKVEPEFSFADGKWQLKCKLRPDASTGSRKWFLYIRQDGYESKITLNLNVFMKPNAELVASIDLKKHSPHRPFKLSYSIPAGIKYIEMSVKYNPHHLQVKSAKLIGSDASSWTLLDNWFGLLMINGKVETTKNFLEITFVPSGKFKSTKIEIARIRGVGVSPEPFAIRPKPHEISISDEETWKSAADFDKSGYVDNVDLGIISGIIGMTKSHPKWNPVYDLNGDLRIDFADYKQTLLRLSN